MKILDAVKNQNRWRVNSFRRHKNRSYTFANYKYDLNDLNIDVDNTRRVTDEDKIFRNEIKKMIEKRIRIYEDLS